MKENSRSVSFERLPPGKYTLKVKVTDIWLHESKIHSLTVVVLPPWYNSVLAKIIYFLIIGILLLLFRKAIIRKIKKDEERKREENERELVNLKNEKLQADIAYKVKELGSSAMMIIQKNKILSDLKELLQKQKAFQNNSLSGKNFNDIMRKIESTLSSHDDWKTFDITFDEAHESFMKNLKSRYPDLSPKDIRLCAFLRMNLPSKEIAPLLGISVRGVENHRYRLRRKMNLEHDENLIEVILTL
jgi:DNA-binding CsgD family transcriptional regulator